MSRSLNSLAYSMGIPIHTRYSEWHRTSPISLMGSISHTYPGLSIWQTDKWLHPKIVPWQKSTNLEDSAWAMRDSSASIWKDSWLSIIELALGIFTIIQMSFVTMQPNRTTQTLTRRSHERWSSGIRTHISSSQCIQLKRQRSSVRIQLPIFCPYTFSLSLNLCCGKIDPPRHPTFTQPTDSAHQDSPLLHGRR